MPKEDFQDFTSNPWHYLFQIEEQRHPDQTEELNAMASMGRYIAEVQEWLAAMEDAPDMTGICTMEEAMDEAIWRMGALGFLPEALNRFQECGKIDSVMEDGICIPLDAADQKRIQDIEDKFGCLVYATVRSRIKAGRVTNYIIVSSHKEDWSWDRIGIEQGTVPAYVYNYDVPAYSESGHIGIELLPGGMLRRV